MKNFTYYILLFVFTTTLLVVTYSYRYEITNQFVNRSILNKISFLEFDPELGWKNRVGADVRWPVVKPEFQGVFKDRRYQIDSNGERHAQFYDKNPMLAPELIVWTLGDSSSFGFGVSGEHTFSERLKKNLYQQKVLVRNFSVTGYNLDQIYRQFKKLIEEESLPPHIVVLWGGFNNVEFTTEIFWHYIRSKFKYWFFKKEYSRMLKFCEDNKVHVIVNTLPSFEGSSNLKFASNWISQQKDRYSRLEINDVRARFAKNRDHSLYAKIDARFPLNFHPSEKGHGIISLMLQQKIEVHLSTHQR